MRAVHQKIEIELKTLPSFSECIGSQSKAFEVGVAQASSPELSINHHKLFEQLLGLRLIVFCILLETKQNRLGNRCLNTEHLKAIQQIKREAIGIQPPVSPLPRPVIKLGKGLIVAARVFFSKGGNYYLCQFIVHLRHTPSCWRFFLRMITCRKAPDHRDYLRAAGFE